MHLTKIGKFGKHVQSLMRAKSCHLRRVVYFFMGVFEASVNKVIYGQMGGKIPLALTIVYNSPVNDTTP